MKKRGAQTRTPPRRSRGAEGRSRVQTASAGGEEGMDVAKIKRETRKAGGHSSRCGVKCIRVKDHTGRKHQVSSRGRRYFTWERGRESGKGD